jgi:hypothetical protein
LQRVNPMEEQSRAALPSECLFGVFLFEFNFQH